ncbi:MAG TPA: hypothetical protein VK475_00070 [Pyrinomonadaceae bacterium]|nr:hypothetical protein [Pyrinomonadaceae bacterium]
MPHTNDEFVNQPVTFLRREDLSERGHLVRPRATRSRWRASLAEALSELRPLADKDVRAP